MLLAAVFLVPGHWYRLLFAPTELYRSLAAGSPPPRLIRLMPVPEVVTEPLADERELPEAETIPDTLPTEPDWWTSGWQARLEEETEQLLDRSEPDSLAALARELVAGSPDIIRLLAERDSSLATRLQLLKIHNEQEFARVKSLLRGRYRAAEYRKILNQGARLFDEFLEEEIDVPR